MRTSRTRSFTGSTPPISASTARRAVGAGARRRRRAVRPASRRSRASSASSSRSARRCRSPCARRSRSRARVASRQSVSSTRPHGLDDPRPVALLGRELAPPGGGEPVVLGAPPVRPSSIRRRSRPPARGGAAPGTASPALTWKVPRVICSMRSAMATPWRGSSSSVRRISRSSVPFTRSSGGLMVGTIADFI